MADLEKQVSIQTKEKQQMKAERKDEREGQKKACCCAFVIIATFASAGTFLIALLAGFCCFMCIKKNKKQIKADGGTLPAFFDSSSEEVSSDSISTDEDIRVEEAENAKHL